MKNPVRNERTKYKTRAVVGGASDSFPHKRLSQARLREFEADSAGYLILSKDPRKK